MQEQSKLGLNGSRHPPELLALCGIADDGSVESAPEGDRHFRQELHQSDVAGDKLRSASVQSHPKDPRLKRAADLCIEGELDAAWDLCNAALLDDPDNVPYLVIASTINDKAKRLTTAYQFAARVTALAPQVCEGWINLGRLNDELYRGEESLACYQKALALDPKPDKRALILANMSGLAITRGRWGEAEHFGRQAMALDPENFKAKANLGTACLAQQKWEEGWWGYSYILGTNYRKKVQFADEPQWDGTPGKSLIIYGEQGLGDEICFASMIPDAMKVAKKTVIECDAKLAGLFQRSFPQASVYGTRWDKNGLPWAEADQHPDASISSGELGPLYRTVNAEFPGTPYLTADPERVAMWKALWSTKGKHAIGVGWTGGVQWTGAKFRTWPVAELEPIMAAINGHYVSLQYKDAKAEIAGTRIVQYPAATLTKDYDDVAGLVASLDLVITMQTAVAHLAGALGIPCIVFVPDGGQWRYGTAEKDTIPWYRSVQVIHQRGDWNKAKDRAIRKARYLLGHS